MAVMRFIVTHCNDLFGRLTTKVLEMPDDTSVFAVKQHLAAQLQVSSTAIVLQTQDNRILLDEQTLTEAGLKENDSLCVDLTPEETKTAAKPHLTVDTTQSKSQWLRNLLEVRPT